MIVFLDSGVLGLLTHPNKKGQPLLCENWPYSLLGKGFRVVSSDICDYEVRRSLLLEATKKMNYNSVNNLNELREYPGRYIVIATTNVKHLSEFTEALKWENIK